MCFGRLQSVTFCRFHIICFVDTTFWSKFERTKGLQICFSHVRVLRVRSITTTTRLHFEKNVNILALTEIKHNQDNSSLSSPDKKCIHEDRNRSSIQHEPHDFGVIPGIINGSAPITQTDKSRPSDKMAALALGWVYNGGNDGDFLLRAGVRNFSLRNHVDLGPEYPFCIFKRAMGILP